jgi:Sec-independent protein secretion pathway component TatC
MLIRFREKISDRLLTGIYRFSGITLIGFGTLLGYKVLLPKVLDFFRLAFAF